MSIYDRDYMKERMREKISMISVSASKVLICANVVAFFLQAFGERIFGRAEFLSVFGLSIDSLASGKVWTLVSYAFMHGDIFQTEPAYNGQHLWIIFTCRNIIDNKIAYQIIRPGHDFTPICID